MQTCTPEFFNAQNLRTKYFSIWDKGVHLFTVDDFDRDFMYSIFCVNFLFTEVIYNKLNGHIITIRSFSDKEKLKHYLQDY